VGDPPQLAAPCACPEPSGRSSGEPGKLRAADPGSVARRTAGVFVTDCNACEGNINATMTCHYWRVADASTAAAAAPLTRACCSKSANVWAMRSRWSCRSRHCRAACSMKCQAVSAAERGENHFRKSARLPTHGGRTWRGNRGLMHRNELGPRGIAGLQAAERSIDIAAVEETEAQVHSIEKRVKSA
jgi:hypothetical protein